MGLSTSERMGCRRILQQLDTSDLDSLYKTVSKTKTAYYLKADLIEKIIEASKTASELLNRKKVYKDQIVQYLNSECIFIPTKITKEEAIQKSLQHWSKSEISITVKPKAAEKRPANSRQLQNATSDIDLGQLSFQIHSLSIHNNQEDSNKVEKANLLTMLDAQSAAALKTRVEGDKMSGALGSSSKINLQKMDNLARQIERFLQEGYDQIRRQQDKKTIVRSLMRELRQVYGHKHHHMAILKKWSDLKRRHMDWVRQIRDEFHPGAPLPSVRPKRTRRQAAEEEEEEDEEEEDAQEERDEEQPGPSQPLPPPAPEEEQEKELQPPHPQIPCETGDREEEQEDDTVPVTISQEVLNEMLGNHLATKGIVDKIEANCQQIAVLEQQNKQLVAQLNKKLEAMTNLHKTMKQHI